jgi:adenine-specific DNA-methyltransferase
MKSKKSSGSFYTPQSIADFLVDYLSDKLNSNSSVSILEPSAGDGVFVKTVIKHESLSKKIERFVVVEKSRRELNKIIKVMKEPIFAAINSDFLDFQLNNNQKFSLVLGNPPYIKTNLLNKQQVKKCKAIHQNANLSNHKPKNIWTSFLIRCIEFTEDNGVLAFVLPSELLQVKFAAELRELILKEFERVEIFTFNELLFKDCKGQDTILLIGERKSANKGVYYCNIDKLDDLSIKKFTLAQNVKIRESKWTHHHLETDEIELLEKIKQKIQTVNYYCNSRAGIVTAANDFFIVDANTVNKYSLNDFIKPIIQRGIFVNGSVILTIEEFQALVYKSKPTYLIALDKNSVIRKNAKLWNYLQTGKDKMIHTRYKTSLRNNWYEVPNVGVPAEAFFFKRCYEYPKLIKNSANVLSTDSAYSITMKENFKVENFIFSFYNSLTLAFAELHGRYYGGGVLELTPNEFKNLPFPYVDIKIDFNSFVKDFKNKATIKDISRENDASILKSIDRNLDQGSIEKVFNIREKLYLRRIKTN